MKYLCLAYYNEKQFGALPKAELDTLVSQCHAHDEELRNSGHMMLVGSLAPTASTASVRPQNGKPVVTDGPYAETKEQVGAFFIIDAKDLNEAIRIASMHPAAHLGEHVGWGIEVRPMEFFQQT